MGLDDVVVVGTHGLEDEPPMPAEVLAEIEAAAAAVGAWVEPKGAAAAVHFRGLEDPEAAEAASVGCAHGDRGGARPGDPSRQAHPRADARPGRPRKGGAVERIARERELRGVLFAGDDVGDLDAFAALERLRAGGLWTCGVVARGAETPPEVEAAADLVVEGTHGVAALLGALATELERAALRLPRASSARTSSMARSCPASHVAGVWASADRWRPRARRVRSSSGISSASRIASAVSERSKGLIARA